MDGEVENPLELTIDDLRSDFEVATLQLELECGGNGRAGFNPPARGNQWTMGAVGCVELDGRAAMRTCCEAAGVEAVGGIHRPLWCGYASVGRSGEGRDLARGTDREGAGSAAT